MNMHSPTANAPHRLRRLWNGKLVAPLALPFFMALTAPVQAQSPQPTAVPRYKNPKSPFEKRVTDLTGRLTLDEKISLLNGSNFAILPVPRLGVPAVRFADAGQGVRGGEEGTHGPATAFPSGVAMAATWNQALIGRVGEAIGVESKNKGIGVHVLLGPAVNIQRSPLGG
ncbi:hypothetical protein EON80_32250, partial [bacterium]